MTLAYGRVLNLDVAVIGCFSKPPFLASLDWHVAPMRMAVEAMNVRFNGSLKLNMDIFYEPRHTANWLQYLDDASYLAARWYYRNRRPEKTSLSVVLSPGA